MGLKWFYRNRNNLFKIWCFLLIILAFYTIAIIVMERGKEWQNIYNYVLKNGQYDFERNKKVDLKKPNILSIEFSRLSATHGESKIEGSISINVYNSEINLSTAKKNEIIKIKLAIECEGDRIAYLPTNVTINCNVGVDYNSNKYLHGWKETLFTPKDGKLFDFPLDKLKFQITVTPENKIIFDKIHFYNRVQGIFLENAPAITMKDNEITLIFNTIRKYTIRITYYIISASLFMYILLVIFFTKKLSVLISAVGGFFISVWSIRSLFKPDARIYPDLMDLTIIFASIILLIGILTRLIFGKFVKDDD